MKSIPPDTYAIAVAVAQIVILMFLMILGKFKRKPKSRGIPPSTRLPPSLPSINYKSDNKT